MSDADLIAASAAGALPPDAEAALLSSLASLRNDGARRLAPVRFHYMEALARRMQGAPEAVRPILRGKLQQALSDWAERAGQGQPPRAAVTPRGSVARHGVTATRDPTATSLAQLNSYIRSATRDATQQGGGDDVRSTAGHALPELKSARRFRETWSRIRAGDAVDQAIGRGPENAGPLNSHRLVLRSLTLMRELSPDYLRRFLWYADSLLWLDRAQSRRGQAPARPKARPARPGRSRK